MPGWLQRGVVTGVRFVPQLVWFVVFLVIVGFLAGDWILATLPRRVWTRSARGPGSSEPSNGARSGGPRGPLNTTGDFVGRLCGVGAC